MAIIIIINNIEFQGYHYNINNVYSVYGIYVCGIPLLSTPISVYDSYIRMYTQLFDAAALFDSE